MPSKNTLLIFRKVHLWFGLFVSPALLFFAFTGAYQTLGLHESSADYKPPRLLAELAQVHKKQTTEMPQRRGPANAAGAGIIPRAISADTPAMADANRVAVNPAGHPSHRNGAATPVVAAPAAAVPPAHERPQGSSAEAAPNRPPQTLASKQRQHLLLKIFFVLVSLGLLTSTITGIYMAYRYNHNKAVVTAVLLLGIAVPLLLLRL